MEAKKLKIGFLSEFSPNDRKASSGTNYKMAEQLKQMGEIKWIPIKRNTRGRIIENVLKGISLLFKKKFEISTTLWGSRIAFSQIDSKEFEDVDVVAAFFCSPVLARIECDKPVVYFTDATYPAMINYYWFNRWSCHNRQGIDIERLAMEKATKVIVSSQWCLDSAMNDLNISSDKIHIVELGANIDDEDVVFSPNEEKSIVPVINILFLGVDWERKGGEIAIDAVRWLNENEIPAHIYIVGIRDLPKEIEQEPFVTNLGFLNKNNKHEYDLLCKTISKCNLELLPTKAEAAGIAFAEAAAHGLPVFTHDTGGIGNYVINGVNGYRLPLGSTGKNFGERIKEVCESNQLAGLSLSSRRLYESTLNWGIWGIKVRNIILSIVTYNNHDL